MHVTDRWSQTDDAPQPQPRDPIRRAMGGILGLLVVIACIEWFVLASRR